MKNILVTGGLGYIGSHTVVELFQSGYEVYVIDNLSNASIEVLDGIAAITGKKPHFTKIDLRDKQDVSDYFDSHKIDGIIHFAASKAVGESVENPLLYYENNLGGLIYLLQQCKKHNVQNFIFSSSCTVYGEADTVPITEDAPVKIAASPYGNTKQVSEEIIIDVTRATNLRAISLRYFNPIGAHESTEIGEQPMGVPQNLVPYLTQTVAGLRDQLAVFGNDYPTRDGSCIRDYIHVVDLAKAHVVALERLFEDKQDDSYEVFNVGTGKGTSVLEVIAAFEAATGRKVPFRIASRREGDVVRVFADTNKANEILGWSAQLTIEEALASAWKWEQKVHSH